MKANYLSQKSRDIVRAIGEGYSCEQILARDHTLTYHDIFRAAAEIPTIRSKKDAAKLRFPGPGQAPVRHRID